MLTSNKVTFFSDPKGCNTSRAQFGDTDKAFQGFALRFTVPPRKMEGVQSRLFPPVGPALP